MGFSGESLLLLLHYQLSHFKLTSELKGFKTVRWWHRMLWMTCGYCLPFIFYSSLKATLTISIFSFLNCFLCFSSPLLPNLLQSVSFFPPDSSQTTPQGHQYISYWKPLASFNVSSLLLIMLYITLHVFCTVIFLAPFTTISFSPPQYPSHSFPDKILSMPYVWS